MKKILFLLLFALSFFSYAQLKESNTEGFYSMKGEINPTKFNAIKKILETDLGSPTNDYGIFIWNGNGSYEVTLSDTSLLIGIQKSNDNQEIVKQIQKTSNQILAVNNAKK